METVAVPGDRLELRIDWRGFRSWSIMIVVSWILVSAVFLIPAVGRWLSGGRDTGVRWTGFFLTTVLAGLLFAKMAWPYRKVSALVFTTAGVWQPGGLTGQFFPWAEVTEVRLIDYGRGGRDILLRTYNRKLKIDALAFESPPALARLIREYVHSPGAQELPTSESS
jgi:hypothetical protein